MRHTKGVCFVVGYTGCLTGVSATSDWTFSITEIWEKTELSTALECGPATMVPNGGPGPVGSEAGKWETASGCETMRYLTNWE